MFGNNFLSKKISIILISPLIILILCTFASAADRPGADFLNIPPSAKALGMGSAFAGSCSDPASFYYNPGAISLFNGYGLTIVNQGLPWGIGRLIEQEILAGAGNIFYGETIKPEPPWLFSSDMRYITGAYVMPVAGIGNLGLDFTYMDAGKVEVRNIEGRLLGSYEPYEVAYGISFGKTFFNRLGTGITVKYIYIFLVPSWVYDSIPELDRRGGIGKAWAADLGLLYRIWGFGVGVSVQNFGTRIRYSEGGVTDRLPLRIRGGISFQPFVMLDSLLLTRNALVFDKPPHDIFNVTLNYDRAYDPEEPDDIWICKGCEFTFMNLFSYRIGNWNIFGTSSGFGFNLRNVEIDIAKYFGNNTYLVQLTMHTPEPPENIRNKKELNKALTIASAALAPGGGQFYKGEGVKGSLFFVPGLYLGNSLLNSDSKTTRSLSAAGLIVLYLASALEAVLNE